MTERLIRPLRSEIMNWKMILFLMFAVAILFSGCTKNEENLQTLGMVNPDLDATDANAIIVSPGTFVGRTIKMRMKNEIEKPADKQFYRNFTMSSGNARFHVEVAVGSWDEVLETLHSGDKIMVYGRFDYNNVDKLQYIYVD